MKKLHITLLAICLTCLANTLLAQGPLLDSTRKNEIGIPVQGILGGAQAPYGLTYRRMVSQGAWRLGIDLLGSDGTTTSTRDSLSRLIGTERFYVAARIGREGHIWIAPKWMLYLGGDLKLGLSALSITQSTTLGRETTSTEVPNNEKIIGLSPFLGFRFQVTPRISLGAEMSYEAQFAFIRNEVISNRDGVIVRSVDKTTTLSHGFSQPRGIYVQVAF